MSFHSIHCLLIYFALVLKRPVQAPRLTLVVEENTLSPKVAARVTRGDAQVGVLGGVLGDSSSSNNNNNNNNNDNDNNNNNNNREQ